MTDITQKPETVLKTETVLQNWRVEIDEQGITHAIIDKAGESTNNLSSDVMAELGQLLDEFDRNQPKAVIFRSGKAAGFIAGANISEFRTLDTKEKGLNLIRRGWDMFERLSKVPYPTLALVKGHCLGGGLELALACRYLLAVDEKSTKMGLPEVMLGIFPGWGGMKRLPERIGAPAALDMMLSGKTIDAKKAKKLGLADDCVPVRVMENAAKMLVLSKQERHKLGIVPKVLSGPLKKLTAKQAREQVAKKARPEHYPAPYAILDIWEKYDGNALQEPELIDKIVNSQTARNLVRVFYLQERLKKFGSESDFRAKHVHVIGAGVMGGDIAAWCALRGLNVTLQDQSTDRIAPAIGRANKLFAKRIKDTLLARDAADRLVPDVYGDGLRRADVIIEAIFENLDAKHELLRNIETVIKPDAIIATNTSSLRLEDLSVVLQNPARLVGIHFFNPVAKMPLVEVVETQNTNPETLKAACAFVKQIDKLPLPVKSSPGFLVNAVLAPYMLEAMRAVDEGISPETIDEAMVKFGMPLGPIELVDTVGLDIAMAAGQQLANGASPPQCLATKIAAGNIGKKSGKGFYVWQNDKAVKEKPDDVPEGLSNRIVTPLIDATKQLVANGIVADKDLADAGVIFGTGFAPFTGGPINYSESYLKE